MRLHAKTERSRRSWRTIAVATMALTTVAALALPATGEGRGNQEQQPVAHSFRIFEDGDVARLPLYEGTEPDGDPVWFLITEASTEEAARRFGVTHAPKLDAVAAAAIQQVTLLAGHGAVKWQFEGEVDFSPVRVIVPDPVTGFPPSVAEPGAIGDANYSPLIELPDGTILNAPVVANMTGRSDRVIDIVGDKVFLTNAEGFYEHEEIYYGSFEASVPLAAALENATYAPRLANVNGAVTDLLDAHMLEAVTNPRSGIVTFTNGPTTGDHTQGLNAALLGLEGPLNVTQSIPGEDAYSPMWNVFAMTWTIDPTLQTDFDEIVGHADAGHLTTTVAGFVVNCPVFSREG